KKAMERARVRTQRNSRTNDDSDEESAQLADAHASVYMADTSGHSTSHWVLDSGASKHIYGRISEFRTLKRFRGPRKIRIRDGILIDAYGYGPIVFPTTEGDLTLRDAWYAPKFDTNLVSVDALNDEGIEVRFLLSKKVVATLD